MPKMMIMSKKKSAPPIKMEELTCPKCGAKLADTPENRKYAAMREEEEYEDEEED